MRAELIKAKDNVTFRGARVSWTFAEDYSDCNLVAFLQIHVRSTRGDHRLLFPDGRDHIDVTFLDNSTEFTNLPCNYGYVFGMTYITRIERAFSSFHGISASLFYGGKSFS